MSSFSDVQSFIADRHGIPEGGRRALLSRLRHLNSANFPPGTKVGKWTRAAYRFDDLLAFSAWFDLVEAFVPPTVAQRIIADLWPELVRAMLTAASTDQRVGTLSLGGTSGTIAIISPYALDYIDGGPRGVGRGAVGAGSWEVRICEALTDVPSARGAVLVIDLARDVRSIIGLPDSGEPINADLLGELLLVASEQGWADDNDVDLPATVTSAATRESEPAGDRLGISDHFFARAVEVLRSRAQADDDESWSPSERDLRHLNYLAKPFQREGWKRYLDFRGTPFLWAFWTALESRDWVAPLPETVKAALHGVLNAEGCNPIDVLIAAALDARNKAPMGRYRKSVLPSRGS